MPEPLTLFLPYPPTANHLFPTGKGGKRVLSREYRAWKADALEALLRQPRRLVPGDVSVEYRIVRPDNRRRDLSNLSKALDDFLVDCQVIEDDSRIQRLVMQWDGTRPSMGVMATITPWTT